MALDITNTQSFFNHYTLGMALIVLAVILRGRALPAPRGLPQRLVENRTSVEDSSSLRRLT